MWFLRSWDASSNHGSLGGLCGRRKVGVSLITRWSTLGWLARFPWLAQLGLDPVQHVVHVDLVLFDEGLDTVESDVAPGSPSLEQDFVLAV